MSVVCCGLRLAVCLSAAILCAANVSHAQSVAGRLRNGSALASRAPDLPILFTVEDAEREGRSFPRNTAGIDSAQAERLSRAGGGGPERRCYSVRDIPEGAGDRDGISRWGVRAGDFVIGGTIRNIVVWRPGKIWWAPVHDPSPQRDPLLLRGARLESARAEGDTMRLQLMTYGFPIGDANASAFFPSGFGIPGTGRWLFVATAGSDWACLLLDVSERK